MDSQKLLPRLDPSNETIPLGGLSVRFLVAGEISNGSIATFELTVKAANASWHPRTATFTMKRLFTGLRVPSPGLSMAMKLRSAGDRHSAFHEAQYTASTTIS